MGSINILGSFQDPLNLDQGASQLVNVRIVPREQTEVREARVRFVGAPGLTQVCRPTTSACITIAAALNTVWTGHADGSIFYGVETPFPTLAGTVAVEFLRQPRRQDLPFAAARTRERAGEQLRHQGSPAG